ncbi:amino acid synthesis family protein [Sphingobium algorifonticola]|uniref:Amino acid synthesis family protein n=1 Tax=Sphingobium algorifonticola TaxID=2008318 RepID=A0A437J9Z5_9SPHN|nr:amino acid synthesis family protein [Sphingobium algorifonticola]RVT42327.1 amino acid synthesis family protein [Sphingobium algorifonticola]
MTVDIRKIGVTLDEIHHDGGPPRTPPLRVVTAYAVVRNPFAGRYVEDIQYWMADLKPLGLDLADRMIAALGDPEQVEAYGKGAIVGSDGELEHGALWHEPGGWSMRERLGDTKAIVFSAKTIGPIGTRLMIPLGHINAAYVRSHFSAAEIGAYDAPRADEILFGLAMATGGRVNARAGGLGVDAIKGQDGLR